MGKKFGYRKFYFSLFHLYLNPPAIKESFSWPFTVGANEESPNIL